ncbi:MAG: CvpA family protein [Kiritimatiellia bacterium]|jgi:uncharacterized membrane protein required for colicin V production
MTAFLQSIEPGEWIDIAAGLVLLLVAIAGSCRGLSGQLASLFAALASVAAGIWFYPHLRGVFAGGSIKATPLLSTVFAVLLAALLSALLFLLLRLLFGKIAHATIRQPVDAILGFLAGLVRGLLLCFVVFAVVFVLPLGDARKTVFEKSVLGRFSSACLHHVLPDGGKPSR